MSSVFDHKELTESKYFIVILNRDLVGQEIKGVSIQKSWSFSDVNVSLWITVPNVNVIQSITYTTAQ